MARQSTVTILGSVLILWSGPSLARASEPDGGLEVKNGWFAIDGNVVWGDGQHNGWWRPGQRPNLARHAPGHAGPNRTEDLDKLTDAMLKFGNITGCRLATIAAW